MSQAPGFLGTPDSGHCSSAATSASCARSSARPTSRTIRARPAMTAATRSSRPRRWRDACRDEASSHDYRSHHLRLRSCIAIGRGHAAGLPLHLGKPGRGLLDVGREIRELLHLAHLDRPRSPRPGQRDAHSIASSFDSPGSSSSRRAPPWPRRTARRSPSACRRRTMTRAPIEGGCRPSSASSTPAFCRDSLYFIIAATASASGMAPGRGLLVALRDHQHHESHRLSPYCWGEQPPSSII